MKPYVYHEINDSEYLGILTIIDYEVPVVNYLEKIKFAHKGNATKILVDFALKVGLSSYRFVEFYISEADTIIYDSNEYVHPSDKLFKLANSYIRELKEYFFNSILLSNEQEMILNDSRAYLHL